MPTWMDPGVTGLGDEGLVSDAQMHAPFQQIDDGLMVIIQMLGDLRAGRLEELRHQHGLADQQGLEHHLAGGELAFQVAHGHQGRPGAGQGIQAGGAGHDRWKKTRELVSESEERTHSHPQGKGLAFPPGLRVSQQADMLGLLA